MNVFSEVTDQISGFHLLFVWDESMERVQILWSFQSLLSDFLNLTFIFYVKIVAIVNIILSILVDIIKNSGKIYSACLVHVCCEIHKQVHTVTDKAEYVLDMCVGKSQPHF